MKRTHTIKIRLSDAERQRISYCAKRAGLTEAGYVRSTSLGHQMKDEVEVQLMAGIISALNKAGNLLNQVAAKLNTGQIIDSQSVKISVEELERRIKDVQMVIKALSDNVGGQDDR